MNSVWTGTTIPLEERCRILSRIGFKGVDLPTAQQVPILKQNGLTPALMTGTGTSFQDGLIRKELHGRFEEAFHAGIDTCASEDGLSGAKTIQSCPNVSFTSGLG